MIYERLVWEGMPFAAQRTNSKSAGPNGPSAIFYEWLLSSCCKCSEKQLAGS